MQSLGNFCFQMWLWFPPFVLTDSTVIVKHNDILQNVTADEWRSTCEVWIGVLQHSALPPTPFVLFRRTVANENKDDAEQMQFCWNASLNLSLCLTPRCGWLTIPVWANDLRSTKTDPQVERCTISFKCLLKPGVRESWVFTLGCNLQFNKAITC